LRGSKKSVAKLITAGWKQRVWVCDVDV